MAYQRNDLVSRAGYSGMGSWWDTVTGVLGTGLKAYGNQQQAEGAAAQANRDLQAALAAQQGTSTTTILLIGGAALAAVLLLRKKRE
jgi:LPXTG-motif cell wall-anchored protein